MSKQTIPWVEKYRPNTFENIVLNQYNRIFLENIISSHSFPNLLFYGPPGTGKTTTISNLIKSYQKETDSEDSSLVIHLNASDERGIDTIRNNINMFVNSKSLFKKGMKFVVLDEVDYMTKNAQQALKYILQSQPSNVRICLICNYISKIDESLQNDFIRMRFSQLPSAKILSFLQNISYKEQLQYTKEQLLAIHQLFNSDMRSMINYMQTNQYISIKHTIIGDDTWKQIIDECKNDLNIDSTIKRVKTLSKSQNIEPKNIIKNIINYIIRYQKTLVNPQFLNICKTIVHSDEVDMNNILYYFFSELQTA